MYFIITITWVVYIIFGISHKFVTNNVNVQLIFNNILTAGTPLF